ncbi:MAG: hypothetical protein HZA20_07440 [Nitrospirae bacterium]|nr:hypothetical protein [Nitrospirota bacterium]
MHADSIAKSMTAAVKHMARCRAGTVIFLMSNAFSTFSAYGLAAKMTALLAVRLKILLADIFFF